MVRFTDGPAMTIAVDWDLKQQNIQTSKNFAVNVICCIFMPEHNR